MRLLAFRDISHITGESCYARVHTTSRSYLIRDTLQNLLTRLPPDRFARVHRSTIVNLDWIQSLEPLTHGESRLYLGGGLSVKASRNFKHAVDGLKRYERSA